MRLLLKCNVIRGEDIFRAGQEIEISPAEAEAMKNVGEIVAENVTLSVMESAASPDVIELPAAPVDEETDTVPLAPIPKTAKKTTAKKPAKSKSAAKKTTKKAR